VDSDKTAKLSFEAALTKLETIVDSMEQGEVPLADLLAKYEEGTKDGVATFEAFETTRAE